MCGEIDIQDLLDKVEWNLPKQQIKTRCEEQKNVYRALIEEVIVKISNAKKQNKKRVQIPISILEQAPKFVDHLRHKGYKIQREPFDGLTWGYLIEDSLYVSF